MSEADNILSKLHDLLLYAILQLSKFPRVGLLLASALHASAYEGMYVSSAFTVNTRWTPAQASGASTVFAVDTRMSGSAGDGLSALFSVDTTASAAVGSGIVIGRVTDVNGMGLPGAVVGVAQNQRLRFRTATDAGGYYVLSGIADGIYELRANLAAYTPASQSGVSVVSGDPAIRNLTLTAIPAAPVVAPVIRPPENPNIVPVSSTQLKVYANGSFDGGSIDQNKMTIIFTHGWNSSPAAWAAFMAEQMQGGGFNNANFLAWDWNVAAGTGADLLKALSRTPGQGVSLGSALAQVLGSSYNKPIHFVGHSLGTLLNAKAADYLNGLPGTSFSPANTHITLLDDAEIANIGGRVTSLGYMVAGSEPIHRIAAGIDFFTVGWASPIPKKGFVWLDNYISGVGNPHDEGVNIALLQSSERTLVYAAVLNPFGMHGYACDWYSETANNPSLSAFGFGTSFERLGASFSSVPTTFPPGSFYAQIPGASEFTLAQLADSDAFLSDARNRLLIGGLTLQQPLINAANAIQSVGSAVIDFAVSTVPSGHPVYTGTAGSTPAYFSDNPAFYYNNIVEEVPILSIQATLQTPGAALLSKKGPGILSAQPLDAGIDTNPPCVWIPVAIPSNAAVFSFDFSFQGDPGEDLLSASIGGTNVFALEAKYMPSNQTLNSGPIPVEGVAGQTVEFFFGLLGGTSSNASVTVNGMRFFTVEPPAVNLAPTGGAMVVSWPATAVGYQLESSPTVSAGGWNPVTNAAGLVGLQSVVTNGFGEPMRFYRLRKP